jgi:membrane protease YdiL (CAAX protease family)
LGELASNTQQRMPGPDRRRLLVYVLIAYASTWALWIPPLLYSASSGWALPTMDQGLAAWVGLTPLQLGMAICFQLAVYGPAVAALVILLQGRDRDELRSWARSIVRFRVAPGWYAFVVLAPLALAALVATVSLAMGGKLAPSAAPAFGALAAMATSQVLTSGIEEPGWRGFALPLLQRTHSAENASWYLGLIWAAWHLPYMLYLYRSLPVWQLPLVLAGFTMSIVAMGTFKLGCTTPLTASR